MERVEPALTTVAAKMACLDHPGPNLCKILVKPPLDLDFS
jgi:hypothetical protein